jgi:hypothetical protein
MVMVTMVEAPPTNDQDHEEPEEAEEAQPVRAADGAQVDVRRLRFQLWRRGCDFRDLIRGERGGPLNANTVSKIRNGGTLHADTLIALRDFLKEHPVDPDIDSFLIAPEA